MRSLLVAAALLLLVPAAASANQWYLENPGTNHGDVHRLTPGTVAEIPTEGTWLLRLKGPSKKDKPVKEECQVSGIDLLSNSNTKAFDEVQSMRFLCPKDVNVTALLPWHGVLKADGEPFIESFTHVAIEVTTRATNWGIFTGTLSAKYGDYDKPDPDDIDNTWKLNGKSGALKNAEGATLQAVASDKYGIKGVNRVDGELNGEPEETGGSGGGE